MDSFVLSIVYGVIIMGLLYIVRLSSKFLTAKINAVKEDDRIREKELARIGLDIAEKAIKSVTEATVGKLEELEAKDIREKIKNGEADATDLCSLAGKAYEEIIATVKPDLIESLSKSIGDAETYIKNQVEHQLGLLKRA